ncbi:hypothetical protein ACLB2K_007493 [Fragaria x ananassa]
MPKNPSHDFSQTQLSHKQPHHVLLFQAIRNPHMSLFPLSSSSPPLCSTLSFGSSLLPPLLILVLEPGSAPAPSKRRPAKTTAYWKVPARGLNGNGNTLVKDSDERIIRVELYKEATDAYMAYAMSMLLGRALPGIRDGLKPVHRSIL